MPVAVIIDWYGPYLTLQDSRTELRGWPNGCKAVYMALRSGNHYNYVGLTSSPSERFYNHPKIHNPENVRFFCGEITSQGIAGRRGGKHKPDFKIAEQALISWLQPKLNFQGKFSEPDDCVVVYSRFFDPKGGETAT